MEYLKYDEIFKKRCPECHGSDHARKRFRKLFGKSFPENGGVVMNNFKYMKQIMNTDYKFDDRELALMYTTMNTPYKMQVVMTITSMKMIMTNVNHDQRMLNNLEIFLKRQRTM